MGFPGNSDGKECACRARDLDLTPAGQETLIWLLGGEDPLEKGMAVFLPGESHGQRNLVGYSPWGHKDSDMTESTQTSDFLFCFISFLISIFNVWVSLNSRDSVCWSFLSFILPHSCPNPSALSNFRGSDQFTHQVLLQLNCFLDKWS